MKLRAFGIFVAFLAVAACGGGSDDTESVAASPEAPVAEAEIDLNDDTIEVLGVYEILDGDQLRADADAEHVAVFERFASVIPAELRPEVTHFVAISQEGSEGTDGAMQQPADPDGNAIEGQYYIALDTTGSASGDELDRTMIHEFGHLLSLRPGQLMPLTPEEIESGDPAECAVFADPECPADDSYLFDYFSVFDAERDAEFDPEVYTTSYAATIPTEDFAESWAEWVRNDDDGTFEVDDDGTVLEITTGSISEAKLIFFEDYPELVEARELIRTGLAG